MNLIRLQALAPGKLLYATKFGSHLYGTDTPTSDTDIVGIYKPRIQDLVLGTDQRTVVYKSNTSNSKNSADDVDVTLYSLQYFCELLRSGEVGSIDLLFSMFRKDTQLFTDSSFINQFISVSNRLVSKQSKAFVGYAFNQAAKYGIKGSRYCDLLEFDQFLSTLPDTLVISDFISLIPPLKYIHAQEVCNITYLSVQGKLHTLNLSIIELRKRVSDAISRTGNRTKLAATANGVDWKALSHAYRAITQFEELCVTDHLVFPLRNAATIKAIKLNDDPSKLDEYLTLIHNSLTSVQQLLDESTLPDKVSKSLLDNIILRTYRV